MYKYHISYVDTVLRNGQVKNEIFDIDLTKLHFFKNHDSNSLRDIDLFTSCFENCDELIKYLKNQGVLDKRYNDIFISIEDDKQNKKMGNNLNEFIFSKDEEFMDINFIENWLNDNIFNIPYINKIIEDSKRKFSNNEKGIPIIFDYVYQILSERSSVEYTIKKIKSDYKSDSEKTIKDFITIEFFNFEVGVENRRGINYYQPVRTSNNYNYRRVHDFIILLKNIDNNLIRYRSRNRTNQNKDYDLYGIIDETPHYLYNDENHEEFMIEEELENGRLRRI